VGGAARQPTAAPGPAREGPAGAGAIAAAACSAAGDLSELISALGLGRGSSVF